MGEKPAVLVLDDGELDDVQTILERLGAVFARIRGGAIVSGRTPAPERLLISTPRRIDAVQKPSGPHGGPVRIVVVSEDSNAMRDRLRAIGFDYIVRRPVHPEALRLLILRCLYRGDERRREPRVPVGVDVSFKTGLLWRRATLVDLSTGGCRLLSRVGLEVGKRIKLVLPPADGQPEVALTGRIARTGIDGGLASTAVVFERIAPDAGARLAAVLAERESGPATLGGEGTSDATRPAPGANAAAPKAPPPAIERVELEVDVRMEQDEAPDVDDKPEPPAESPSPAGSRDRRTSRRGVYAGKVPAFGSDALRVLIGRDLSVGGMRVEPFSHLELGDRLHLAIYGDSDREPFLVWATAVRDDGVDGMALAFDELHPAVAAQLEKLVATLPAVESLHDAEAQAMGTVVSEILRD